jgi:hypothetical protein
LVLGGSDFERRVVDAFCNSPGRSGGLDMLERRLGVVAGLSEGFTVEGRTVGFGEGRLTPSSRRSPSAFRLTGGLGRVRAGLGFCDSTGFSPVMEAKRLLIPPTMAGNLRWLL